MTFLNGLDALLSLSSSVDSSECMQSIQQVQDNLQKQFLLNEGCCISKPTKLQMGMEFRYLSDIIKSFGDLGIDEIDITNQSNQFQGDLRYGHLSWAHLENRILNDYDRLPDQIGLSPTLMATHVNSEFIEDLNKDHLSTFVDDCYISASPYSEEVEAWRSYEEE